MSAFETEGEAGAASPFTEAAVHDALDRAVENGYDLKTWHEVDIAHDLTAHDCEFESRSVDEVLPHILTWLAR